MHASSELDPALRVRCREDLRTGALNDVERSAQACRQLQVWLTAGLRLPARLSVNLAVQQLENPMFANRAETIVTDAGLDPHCLELELTESGLMNNVHGAIEMMDRLKSAGFALSIDDFGTGYSSLSYLKRFPADTLKIDISFVRDMLSDHSDYTIVSTIIGMAHSLGLKALAEGVEHCEQAKALLLLGCDEVQGYHYGRPLSAEDFAETWLAKPEFHPIAIPRDISPRSGRRVAGLKH